MSLYRCSPRLLHQIVQQQRPIPISHLGSCRSYALTPQPTTIRGKLEKAWRDRGKRRPYGSGSQARRAIGGGFLFACGLVGVGIVFGGKDSKLSPDRFVPLKVISVTPLTKETSLFKLALPKESLPIAKPGELAVAEPIRSVYVMQPELNIQRPYTPLSSSAFDPSGSGELDLVVKRYPDGEVSRWMHRLSPGDQVHVRAPTVTWDYRKGDWDEVVFVVGGTGITPAYQFLEHMIKSPKDAARPKISIIYSSPSPSTVLLKSSLDELVAQDPSKFSIRYLVDEPVQGEKLPSGLILGRSQTKTLNEWVGKGGNARRVVVVCGPDGMIRAVAGQLARDQTQGPVGGILRELGYSSSEVVKL